MTPAEREQVEAMLPSEFEDLEAMPPEGDPHSRATATARFTLEAFFRKIGRKIYVSSNLPVYYPNERMFGPDLLAVRDVGTHDRDRWLVEKEGRGLDFVLEIHVAGDRAKDERKNVDRYAQLGIPEYFFFDRRRRILRGYRLPMAERIKSRPTYQPIVPQQGLYTSEVLGLDVTMEGDKLRFVLDGAPVPEAEELIAKLGQALDQALAANEEEQRRVEEEQKRREEAEIALAEARAEIERLRRGG